MHNVLFQLQQVAWASPLPPMLVTSLFQPLTSCSPDSTSRRRSSIRPSRKSLYKSLIRQVTRARWELTHLVKVFFCTASRSSARQNPSHTEWGRIDISIAHSSIPQPGGKEYTMHAEDLRLFPEKILGTYKHMKLPCPESEPWSLTVNFIYSDWPVLQGLWLTCFTSSAAWPFQLEMPVEADDLLLSHGPCHVLKAFAPSKILSAAARQRRECWT